MEEKILKVTGMTCASCSAKIEKVVGKIDGVNKANVNLISNELKIDYDSNRINIENVKQKIERLGYGVKDISKIDEVYKVDGMTCSACAASIEKALKRLQGVESGAINFATKTLTISYDSEIVTIDDISKKISKLGFKLYKDDELLESKDVVDKEVKFTKDRLIYTAIFGVPVFIIAMGHMVGMPLPDFMNPEISPFTFAMVQFVLSTLVFYFGRSFFKTGMKSLFALAPNMDSLISIGSGAAYIYSIYGTYKIAAGNIHFVHELYFESAALIIVFVSLGKFLESVAKGKTSDAIKKLMGLAPKVATVIVDGEEKSISIDDVRVGDLIVVKPGEKLPVDGEIIEGKTSINESMLTGESIPAEKTIGSFVYGASINKNGRIIYRATKVGKDTVISQIVKLVKDAQGSKAPIAKTADIISGYFVPVVIILALASSIFWGVRGEDLQFVMTIFIAVLVIACPCALGLATPTAIMVGTGKGAENGVLIKGGESLETAGKIQTIVFDKTGTLTEGKPIVTNIITQNYSEDEILSIAGAAEKASEHPLGEAIVRHAELKNLELKKIDKFTAIPGMGIEVTIGSEDVYIGNKKLLDENGFKIEGYFASEAQELAKQGKTPMYVIIDGKLEAIIAVADTVKSSSKKAVEILDKMGIEVVMLTGDNEKTAKAIAKELGISRVVAEVLPHEKANKIKELQEEGKKVAMVGDGINDAPALAIADVGMAIGSGTDIAMESADIVLMKSDIMDVISAIQLSKKTMINIKENLFWGLIFNVIGIPIAMGVLYLFGGTLLNPMIGAFAMSFSSVAVLLNALRLKTFKPKLY